VTYVLKQISVILTKKKDCVKVALIIVITKFNIDPLPEHQTN